jgi:archaellum component FlaF (FlaF/FlaG flagellin family)
MARREGTRTWRILIWLMVLVVFVGYLLWALQSEEVFQVLNKRLEQTSAGVVVSGEIYNAAEATSTVNVEVTFFDGQGRQLGKEVVTVDNLSAGATVPFRTKPQLLGDVRNYTIYVNTGRNMYGN